MLPWYTGREAQNVMMRVDTKRGKCKESSSKCVCCSRVFNDCFAKQTRLVRRAKNAA